MIPHIIHYCWFGPAEKSELIRKCIASWHRYHPDWEIKEWNETNYDVNKIPYIQEAYRQKKWAFVVDYARFDILNQCGGVFLDADVEFVRAIPDEYMEYEAFTGFESGHKIAPGLIYASIPHQKMLQEIMEDYEHRKFGTGGTICDIVTGLLVQNGMRNDDTCQNVNGVVVFPPDYFCCFDHETQHFSLTENTVAIHHYAASWSNWRRKSRFRLIWLLAEILGPERYKKLKHRLIKAGCKR